MNIALDLLRLKQQEIAESREDCGYDQIAKWDELQEAINVLFAPPVYRCFHCEEHFADRESAALHFGKTQYSTPSCQVDAASLRELEATVRSYNEEDTSLHRQIYALESKHQIELRRMEETGYARGIKDATELVLAPSLGNDERVQFEDHYNLTDAQKRRMDYLNPDPEIHHLYYDDTIQERWVGWQSRSLQRYDKPVVLALDDADAYMVVMPTGEPTHLRFQHINAQLIVDQQKLGSTIEPLYKRKSA